MAELSKYYGKSIIELMKKEDIRKLLKLYDLKNEAINKLLYVFYIPKGYNFNN